MDSEEIRAWFASSTWIKFKDLWARAFSTKPPPHAKLKSKFQALSRELASSTGEPPKASREGIDLLREQLESRISALRPKERRRGFHPHRPAPDPIEVLAGSVSALREDLLAAQILERSQADKSFLDEEILPRVGMALQIVERNMQDSKIPDSQKKEAEELVATVRKWLGPGHAVLPESRLALWPKSKAWAELKKLYEVFDTADKTTHLGDLLADARDRWHAQMASAMPTREDLAAQLYRALGASYTWKMDRLSWSYNPKRTDALEHHLNRVGHGYLALWELEQIRAEDPWIRQVLEPSIARAVEELVEHIEVYRQAGGDAELVRLANEAVKSMRAHEKLRAWSDWT